MTPLASFLESYYRLRPVNATFTGIHDHDGRLPDWSPEGLDAAAAEMRRLRADLAGSGGGGTSLDDVARRDRALALSFLDVQLAEHESRHFQHANPSLALGEAVFGVISLMTRPFAPVADRAIAAVDRLDAIPAFLEGARRSLAAGTPDEWRAKCLRECDGADALLGRGVERWVAVERIGAAEARRLRPAAVRAGAAFGDFRRWLTRDLPAAKPDRLACGPDLFDRLLDRGHWCEAPRRDLLVEARERLEEALATLDGRSRRIAGGGWPEVQQRLMAARATTEGYLGEHQRLWAECRRLAEGRDLVTWPDAPLRYVPIPEQTREAAPFLYYLFYRSPAPYDRLAVHDYVVTPVDSTMDEAEQQRRLGAANLSVIKLNHVVHHGGIGHHVQNAHAYACPSAVGRIAGVDCANRIGMFLGGTMTEGWACYATDLMDDAEFLTPEESLSQQHTRARLLARAVADIGLHERSMTFEEAVALYRDRIGMPADAARAEARKNSMFPCTALMYWLGTEAIHRLRRTRERIEGSAFSLRQFHDTLLSFGSIPVPLLARVWP